MDGRLIAADWERGLIKIRIQNRKRNIYTNVDVPIANLHSESQARLQRLAPLEYVFPGTPALATTPPQPSVLLEFEAMTLLVEPPLKSNIRLSENLKGSRKISLNLVDGVVTLLVNSRPAGTANIADPEYLAAVKSGTLNQYFKVDWITKDRAGNYNVPIKVESFPLLGQEGPTCWAASFREWGWHFLGKRAPYTPALDDMRTFMNFIEGSKSEDFYTTSAKEKLDQDYEVELPGQWVTLFLGAEVRSFVPVSNPAMVSDLLLTGHGQVGTGNDIRTGHAFAVLGTDRDKYFISTWQREYFGRGRQIPYPVEKVTIITPRRDAQGAVLVPVAPQARNGLEARLMASLQKKIEKLE